MLLVTARSFDYSPTTTNELGKKSGFWQVLADLRPTHYILDEEKSVILQNIQAVLRKSVY